MCVRHCVVKLAFAVIVEFNIECVVDVIRPARITPETLATYANLDHPTRKCAHVFGKAGVVG